VQAKRTAKDIEKEVHKLTHAFQPAKEQQNIEQARATLTNAEFFLWKVKTFPDPSLIPPPLSPFFFPFAKISVDLEQCTRGANKNRTLYLVRGV
jgi:hypothetical protein